MNAKRIVSLIASSTETVCALGFEQELVGRSHECDFPPSVKRLPVCTEPKFKTEGTSREIDERVRRIVADGLSVYRVDVDALERLKPDVILTQTQCEVCAVSLRDVEEAVARLVSSKPRIVSLQPNRLSDVWSDIERVADALGAPERGVQLVGDLKHRMAAVAGKEKALLSAPGRMGVAFIEWMDPLLVGGNWMPELVEMAGGRNLFGEAGKHSPSFEWERLTEQDPDIVFVAPCGWDIPKIRSEMGALTSRPRWADLKAVRNKRVILADGNRYFNRPGPRLAESLEILAEVLHPAAFRFGHEGTGWEYL